MKAIIALVVFAFLFYFSFVKLSFAVTLFSSNFDNGNISSWASSGGGTTATISAELSRSNPYSLKVQNDKITTWGYEAVVQDIEPGMFYEISGFGRPGNTNLNTYSIRVAWYAAGSTSQLSSPNQSNIGSSSDTDWIKLTTNAIQAPSNANSAKVRLVLTSKTSGQLANAYFDDVSFVESIAPTPIPTPSPTSTPTPTPSPTTTRTPTPTPIPSLSPIPTKIFIELWKEASNGSEILGTSSAEPKLSEETSKPETKTLGTSENIMERVFIILGILTIITSAGILIRQKWIKQ